MFYVNLFSALLTPLIAIITTYIMIQQYRNEKRTQRYQVFGHRHEIYEATMKLITTIIQNATISRNELSEYAFGVRNSKIFFGKDVNDYLWKLRVKASKLMTTVSVRESKSIGEERNNLLIQEEELINFFIEQTDECKTVFEKYLDFKKP